MIKRWIILSLILFPLSLFADMTGEEIMKKVDTAMDISNAVTRVEMNVYRSDRLVKNYKMKMMSDGYDKALVEMLYPPRNMGEKVLKVEDDVWIYRPKINKVIRVSGRANFSGSDFSNTDILSVQLNRDYTAELAAIVDFEGTTAYQLELTAKSDTVTYARIVYWIRKHDFFPLRRDFYTISGHLLKSLVMEKHTQLFDKMPDTFVMTNVMEKNKKSVMRYVAYKPVNEIPDRYFRVSALKRER